MWRNMYTGIILLPIALQYASVASDQHWNPHDASTCLDLTQAVRCLRDVYAMTLDEFHRPEGLSQTVSSRRLVKDIAYVHLGLDIYNDDILQEFICNLTAATCIEDVGELLPIPAEQIWIDYTHALDTLQQAGGVAGLTNLIRLIHTLVPAVQTTTFPQWPLGALLAPTIEFVEGMVEVFGPDFLGTLTEGVADGLHAPLNLTITDSMAFSIALVSAHSLPDFTFRLDWNLHDVEVAAWYLDSYLAPDQYDVLLREDMCFVDLLHAAEPMGLLALPFAKYDNVTIYYD